MYALFFRSVFEKKKEGMKIKMNQTEENVLRPLVNRPSPRNGPRIVRIPQPPPQPHMCVQDTLKVLTKLKANVSINANQQYIIQEQIVYYI